MVWIWKRKIFHGNKSFSASVPPGSSRNGLFAIGSEVERDKQHQVGAEDDQTRDSRKFLSSAGSRIWHEWEISAGEVGVRSEVHKAQVDDELDNLQHGDVFLPPNFDATGGLEVIPIPVSAQGSCFLSLDLPSLTNTSQRARSGSV